MNKDLLWACQHTQGLCMGHLIGVTVFQVHFYRGPSLTHILSSAPALILFFSLSPQLLSVLLSSAPGLLLFYIILYTQGGGAGICGATHLTVSGLYPRSLQGHTPHFHFDFHFSSPSLSPLLASNSWKSKALCSWCEVFVEHLQRHFFLLFSSYSLLISLHSYSMWQTFNSLYPFPQCMKPETQRISAFLKKKKKSRLQLDCHRQVDLLSSPPKDRCPDLLFI